VGDELGTGVHPEFGENIRQVTFDRGYADKQFSGDLPIVHAGCDQSDYR
jgi:hypothetical protein